MAAQLLLALAVFGLAFLGLAIGVIFNKKTPLKGSCKSVVDGGHAEKCTCSGDEDDCDKVDDMKSALQNGNFSVERLDG